MTMTTAENTAENNTGTTQYPNQISKRGPQTIDQTCELVRTALENGGAVKIQISAVGDVFNADIEITPNSDYQIKPDAANV